MQQSASKSQPKKVNTPPYLGNIDKTRLKNFAKNAALKPYCNLKGIPITSA